MCGEKNYSSYLILCLFIPNCFVVLIGQTEVKNLEKNIIKQESPDIEEVEDRIEQQAGQDTEGKYQHHPTFHLICLSVICTLGVCHASLCGCTV